MELPCHEGGVRTKGLLSVALILGEPVIHSKIRLCFVLKVRKSDQCYDHSSIKRNRQWKSPAFIQTKYF